jgi:hypothetical protein
MLRRHRSGGLDLDRALEVAVGGARSAGDGLSVHGRGRPPVRRLDFRRGQGIATVSQLLHQQGHQGAEARSDSRFAAQGHRQIFWHESLCAVGKSPNRVDDRRLVPTDGLLLGFQPGGDRQPFGFRLDGGRPANFLEPVGFPLGTRFDGFSAVFGDIDANGRLG